MIFFLLLPLWLIGLAGCAVLAIFRPLRVMSVYCATMGTLAVWISLVLSSLALMAPGWLSLPVGNGFGGVLMIGGYVVGGGVGGLLGIALGAVIARWMTRAEPIFPPQVEAALGIRTARR